MDIAEWLQGLGLGRYAPAFAENAINWDVLPELTADDLKEIGVAAVGAGCWRRSLRSAAVRFQPHRWRRWQRYPRMCPPRPSGAA